MVGAGRALVSEGRMNKSNVSLNGRALQSRNDDIANLLTRRRSWVLTAFAVALGACSAGAVATPNDRNGLNSVGGGAGESGSGSGGGAGGSSGDGRSVV